MRTASEWVWSNFDYILNFTLLYFRYVASTAKDGCLCFWRWDPDTLAFRYNMYMYMYMTDQSKLGILLLFFSLVLCQSNSWRRTESEIRRFALPSAQVHVYTVHVANSKLMSCTFYMFICLLCLQVVHSLLREVRTVS